MKRLTVSIFRTTKTHWFASVFLAICCTFAAGCSTLMVGSLRSLTQTVPDFEATTEFSLRDDPNLRTVVLCNVPDRLRENYPEIGNDLAMNVTKTLSRHHVAVAENDIIHTWMEAHPDWKQHTAIGRDLGAAFVVNLDFHDYREGVPPLESSAPGVIVEPDRHSKKKTNAKPRTEAAVTVSVIHASPLDGDVLVYRKTVTVSAEEPQENETLRESFDALLLVSIAREIGSLLCDIPADHRALGDISYVARLSESSLPR